MTTLHGAHTEAEPAVAKRPWPLIGYAPGDYLNRCMVCGEGFIGDKRAIHCIDCAAARANELLAGAPRASLAETYQARVEPWMRKCFGDVIPFDKEERGDRFLEEVFELLQSGGYDPSRIATLRDYTWSRPVGEPSQGVGGVMVTLAAYCLAFGLDMHGAGETELARIWTKVEAIRAKQAAKPRGIALPIAPAEAASPVERPVTDPGMQNDQTGKDVA